MGATYNYSVKAYDAAGNVSNASNSVTVVIPVVAVSVSITSYSVSNKTGSSAVIKWSTNVPSTGFVSYGLSSSSLNLSATDSASGTSHALTVTGLKSLTKYYYKISVVSADGSSSAVSPVSNFKTVKK